MPGTRKTKVAGQLLDDYLESLLLESYAAAAARTPPSPLWLMLSHSVLPPLRVHVRSQAESSDLAQVRVACLTSPPHVVLSLPMCVRRFRVKREVFGEKRKFTVLDNVPSTASYHKHCVSVRSAYPNGARAVAHGRLARRRSCATSRRPSVVFRSTSTTSRAARSACLASGDSLNVSVSRACRANATAPRSAPYELPDGKTLELGPERYLPGERLFVVAPELEVRSCRCCRPRCHGCCRWRDSQRSRASVPQIKEDLDAKRQFVFQGLPKMISTRRAPSPFHNHSAAQRSRSLGN